MYTITKQFSFSASHRLDGLPDDHPCSRLHGHNYVVEVELRSVTLNGVGFVIDYRALDSFKNMLDVVCDHRDLNEVMPSLLDDNAGINPTAENLAAAFFDIAAGMFDTQRQPGFDAFIDDLQIVFVSAVRVRETDKTMAEYRL